MIRIACIGEVMIELIPGANGAAALGVAGDVYNTAAYLSRLLPEAQVACVTALGQDGFSDRILSEMKRHGVVTTHVERRADKVPGLYAIETDAAGERTFTYWRSDSAARTLFSEPCEIGLHSLADFDLILLSGITMAILPTMVRTALMARLSALREGGARIAYDSNYRPRLWEDVETARQVNAAMWALADIALPSVDDEMALFGDPDGAAVLSRIRGYGCSEGALKRGMEGPVAIAEGIAQGTFAPVARAVDTTAAGDSFNAGFLAAHLSGASTAEALQQAHGVASQVIAQRGAIVPIR